MTEKITYVGARKSGRDTVIEIWNDGEKFIFSPQAATQKDQEKLRAILDGSKEM
jgi:hypothetical protein